MTLTRNPKGMEKLRQALAKKMERAGDEAVTRLKNASRVDTGRMRESVRHTEAAQRKDRIEMLILVGGTVQEGVVREQGIPREVDYAAIVETRFGDFRRSLPEVLDAFREEFK